MYIHDVSRHRELSDETIQIEILLFSFDVVSADLLGLGHIEAVFGGRAHVEAVSGSVHVEAVSWSSHVEAVCGGSRASNFLERTGFFASQRSASLKFRFVLFSIYLLNIICFCSSLKSIFKVILSLGVLSPNDKMNTNSNGIFPTEMGWVVLFYLFRSDLSNDNKHIITIA